MKDAWDVYSHVQFYIKMPELSKVVVSFNSLSMKFQSTVKLRRINEKKSYSSHTKDYNSRGRLSETLRAVCLSEGDGSVMYIFKTQDILIFYIKFTKD